MLLVGVPPGSLRLTVFSVKRRCPGWSRGLGGDEPAPCGLPAGRQAERYGEARAEIAVAKVERILAEELTRRVWKPLAVRAWPKGEGEKVALAARLRAETSTCLPCLRALAHRLAAGR